MIEVEKKFMLSPEQQQRLLKGAEYLNQKTQHDIYYDTPDYLLTMQDKWLRKRNDHWELKHPVRTCEPSGKKRTHYKEFETDEEIIQAMDLDPDSPLTDQLMAAGYVPIAEYTTIRKTYKRDPYTIVIDATDFDYDIAEVEILAQDPEDSIRKFQQLREFAEELGLSMERQNGKLLEYLYRNNRQLYDDYLTAQEPHYN
ncbi:CYTH domain-containing protein [Candidatus Uhrbacteria bacterium]|nr:CYTH domain-containing protein [Candidatus Uhrbacteria bacterium]MBD3283848.1 CYTH domain-containing protein [Candidatus Uhrbacteria bacterium]